ncbi:hypothetical protein VNO77_33719 [Canavalia gladiata]|uniref:Uncharacterized protein n=1 Tax=Canavalia gladiata TaxID=3824 RepID=A0AAN9PZ65_CANGL
MGLCILEHCVICFKSVYKNGLMDSYTLFLEIKIDNLKCTLKARANRFKIHAWKEKFLTNSIANLWTHSISFYARYTFYCIEHRKFSLGGPINLMDEISRLDKVCML